MKRKHSTEVDATVAAVAAEAPVVPAVEAVPATTTVAVGSTAPKPAKTTEASFASFGLDARLLQAIAKLGFASPTLVQEKAIPLALEGKDILGMFLSVRRRWWWLCAER